MLEDVAPDGRRLPSLPSAGAVSEGVGAAGGHGRGRCSWVGARATCFKADAGNQSQSWTGHRRAQGECAAASPPGFHVGLGGGRVEGGTVTMGKRRKETREGGDGHFRGPRRPSAKSWRGFPLLGTVAGGGAMPGSAPAATVPSPPLGVRSPSVPPVRTLVTVRPAQVTQDNFYLKTFNLVTSVKSLISPYKVTFTDGRGQSLAPLGGHPSAYCSGCLGHQKTVRLPSKDQGHPEFNLTATR